MTSPPPARTAGRPGVGRLWSEAVRNRFARAALTLAVLAAWATAGLAVYITERDAVQASASYTSSMLASGYATLLVEQSETAQERLTWDDCNTLRHLDGVQAVVGLREPEILRLWDSSGPEITARQAMGDVAGYLAVTSPQSIQRWVAPSVIFDTEAFGARPAQGTVGEYVTKVVQLSGDGDTRTAISASLTSLGGGFSGNTLMLTPPGGQIAICVVLSELDQRPQVADAVAGFLPVSAGFGQRWALTNAERFDPPRQRYESRESRWYWLAAVALVSTSWGFSMWILRNDLAVYAVAGLGTRRLIMLTITEMSVIVIGAALIVTGVAISDLVVRDDARDAFGAGARAAARTIVGGIGVSAAIAAATAVSICRRTIDALKNR